jgi:hypothetical protein
MDASPEIQALVQRVQTLERRQRRWTRAALAVCAAATLTFAGWAPFDDIETDLRDIESPAPATTKVVPDDEPADPPPTTDPEPAPADVDSSSDLEDPGDEPASGFQSYTHREGDEPYLPSRVEWISLRASAELPRGGAENDFYGIMYGPDGKGSNTIRVACTYDAKRANREKMQQELKYAQMQLEGLAKMYGWTWLEVRIETRAVN